MNNLEPENKICPSLGLLDDEDSSFAFPSNLNYCHRSYPAASIRLIHQGDLCLSGQYRECPVYLRQQARPASASAPKRRVRKKKAGKIPWQVVGIALVMFIAAFGFWNSGLLFPTGGQATRATAVSSVAAETVMPTRAATSVSIVAPITWVTLTNAPTITPTPTITLTPALTITLPPTIMPTSVLIKRRLDIPFGTTYKFVIHKTKGAEKLETFAEKYNTTVAAILAINYRLTDPTWSDVLFVIPVGFSNVKGLPVFVVYQIKEEERGISSEELAAKLRVNPFDLKYYNDLLAEGARPLVGDLILVPWSDANIKIPGEPDSWNK